MPHPVYTLILEILVVACGKRCYKILFVELEIRKEHPT
jgi:hypothetical protein